MTQNQYYKSFISLAVSLLCWSPSLYASEIAEDNSELSKYSSKQNEILFDKTFIQKNKISYDVIILLQEIASESNFYPKTYGFRNEELKNFFEEYKTQSLNKLDHTVLDLCFELVQKNFVFSDIIKLAKKGHSEAQFQAAMILRYDEADETQESKKLAYKFFHQAAAQGHAESMYELSDIYDRMFLEFDIDRDASIAHLLCQEAAYIGLEKAKLEIASIPLDGKFNFSKDYEKAKNNLKKLADEGSLMAKERFEYLQNTTQKEYEFLSSM